MFISEPSTIYLLLSVSVTNLQLRNPVTVGLGGLSPTSTISRIQGTFYHQILLCKLPYKVLPGDVCFKLRLSLFKVVFLRLVGVVHVPIYVHDYFVLHTYVHNMCECFNILKLNIQLSKCVYSQCMAASLLL